MNCFGKISITAYLYFTMTNKVNQLDKCNIKSTLRFEIFSCKLGHLYSNYKE